MNILLTIVLFTGSLQSPVPDTLTLDYCHSRIENHYPIARKLALQDEITSLNKKIANTASYPQFNFGATATYQSEVTEFTSPDGGPDIGPDLSKDQYRATMDVSQTIYNAGAVKAWKNLEEATGASGKHATEVELHRIKEQVNQVYFGILLSRQQQEIVAALAKSLRTQLKSIRSKVSNGVMLPSQQYILEAELEKVMQDSTDVHSSIKSGLEVLGKLIDEEISENALLKLPDSTIPSGISLSNARLRPEFDLFESNRVTLKYQKELAATKKMPALSAFGTAAYGRPGFNVFENNLHGYYQVGVKLQWNFWESLNAGSKQQIYSIKQKSINEEETAFRRQLNARLGEIEQRIRSLENQIKRDEEILELREKVVATVSSQLQNGTATATEYVTELTKATQARLSMQLHKTRLSQAKIDYKTALGIND